MRWGGLSWARPPEESSRLGLPSAGREGSKLPKVVFAPLALDGQGNAQDTA